MMTYQDSVCSFRSLFLYRYFAFASALSSQTELLAQQFSFAASQIQERLASKYFSWEKEN